MLTSMDSLNYITNRFYYFGCCCSFVYCVRLSIIRNITINRLAINVSSSTRVN